MSEELTEKESQAITNTIDQSQLTDKAYKVILSQNPPSEIVRHHSYGKFDYLPITAVERLLDGLFAGWTVEILRESTAVNGFYVVVRVSANIPNSDKVLKADGIGFAEFQTLKGAKPTDFTQLIQGAGVLAVPKAKAEAIKNAVKSFGNLFGRNLARDDDRAEREVSVVNQSRAKIGRALEAKNES